MFEAIVYDERDRASEHPGSTLGSFDDRINALEAIVAYLQSVPEHAGSIYKMEVVAS